MKVIDVEQLLSYMELQLNSYRAIRDDTSVGKQLNERAKFAVVGYETALEDVRGMPIIEIDEGRMKIK